MKPERPRFLAHMFLGLFCILTIGPVVLMWVTSIKSKQDLADQPLRLPSNLELSNFSEAWNVASFDSAFKSSLIVAVITVSLSVVLSLLAGYGFGRFDFPLKKLLFLYLLVGVMVPTEAIIIPLFHIFDRVGLTNTYWALILPQVGQSVAFGTFWMAAFFVQAPVALEDAAAIDGASSLRTLRSIWLPLARPAILTLTLLLFMWTWNEFLLSLVLIQDESLRTLPVALSFFQGRYLTNVPLLAAAGTMMTAPILVLYAFFSRRFMEGLTSGSVKG